MENTLRKLLTSQQAIIDEGTRELKQYMQQPECVSTLFNILTSNPAASIRQYAAVLLKRRFSKQSQWEHIIGDDRKSIKSGLLQMLVSEPEQYVKNCIVQLIGVLVKHDLQANQWPELSQFLYQSLSSAEGKELGFYTLSVLLETAPVEFASSATTLTTLLAETLRSSDKSSQVAFYIIICMIHFAPVVYPNRALVNEYIAMMPDVLEVIKALSVKRPDKANDAMDFFDEYSCREGMAIVTPYLKQIVEFCLSLAGNTNIPGDLRIKALNYLSSLANRRIKLLLRYDLVLPILNTVCTVMSAKPNCENYDDSSAFDADEEVLACSLDTLGHIILRVDQKRLIDPVTDFVRRTLSSEDPYEQRASYLVMAVISEAWEKHIRDKCLDQMVSWVCGGVQSPHPCVKSAALFAIGQFAEFLQPEISGFAAEILPILIWQIRGLHEIGKSGDLPRQNVKGLLGAVDRFADNLEGEFKPFLGDLMAALLPLWLPPYHRKIKELAMNCTATIVSAANGDIVPYFNEIMERLNTYLCNKAEGDDIRLQVEAIDTLAQLAQSVGVHFEPLAMESVNLGLRLMVSSEDPDVIQSCYGLLSAISYVLKEKMAPVLPNIVSRMIKSIRENPEEPRTCKAGGEHSLYDSSDDEENIEESEDESDAISVENDYLEEKEEACAALSDIAKNTGEAFRPYLQSCFEEVFKLLDFPNRDLRRAALDAEFQFVIAFARITTDFFDQNLINVAEMLVDRAANLVTMDHDQDVVITALDGLEGLLKEVGPRLSSSTNIKDSTLKAILEVMNHKTEVLKWVDDEPDDVPDFEIVDYAAFIIPQLAKTMANHEFSVVFANMLPLLDSRMKPATSDDGDESEAKVSMIGVLAQCMAGLGPEVGAFTEHFVPFFLTEATNPGDINIRNNALFALGELAFHGKDKVFPYYSKILETLSQVMAEEKKPKVIDNACGLIARLILVNPSDLPLEQLVPAFVARLPLKEDHTEDKYVYCALGSLIELGVECLKPEVCAVFKAAASTAHRSHTDPETREVVLSVLNLLVQRFPNECKIAMSQLPPEIAASLNS